MNNLSFTQVTALWKESKQQYVKKSTYSIYTQLCRCYILPAFAEAETIDEQHIQTFVNDLLARGYALKTIKDTMLVLKMILRHGEKLGTWPHIEYTVHYPSESQTKKRQLDTLTVPQQQRLAKYLRDNLSFFHLGILLCMHSGLRNGELCGLQWTDLDVDAGVIHVHKTVQHIWLSDGDVKEDALSIDRPKTASSVRDIPLSKELKSLIRPFKKVCPEDNYLLSNASKPMEPRQCRDQFYRILKQLDIPQVRFHALRYADFFIMPIFLSRSLIYNTMRSRKSA